MIKQGQTLDRDNLNRAFLSKTATGTQIVVGGVTLTGILTAATLTGAHTGDGSGLTGLNGTNISSGTVADGRLSSNVMLLATAQTITAHKTFNASSNLYFAGGTTYYVNNVGTANLNGLTANGVLQANGGLAIAGGQTMNFGSSGVATPTGTTISAGTKARYYANNYSMGVESGHLWYDANNGHKFYYNTGGATSTLLLTVANTGTTLATDLTVSGLTTLTGNVATTNDLTVSKNLEVQGEIKHAIENEFPDPLMASADISLWAATRGTMALDVAQSPVSIGAYGSVSLTATAADAYSYYTYYFDVQPNEWITYSAYVYCTTTNKASQLSIMFGDSAKADLLYVSADTANTAASWTRYSVTAQAPANARYFRVRIDNDGGTGTVMYFTGFQVERGRARTGLKAFTGANQSSSMSYGSIHLLGSKVNSSTYGPGILTLSNENGTGGRISSLSNPGLLFRYNSSIIDLKSTLILDTSKKIQMSDGTNTTDLIVPYGPYSNGFGVMIQSSGQMILGSGEAASTTYTAVGSAGNEDLYLASDNNIIFFANLQTDYASRKTMVFNTSGYFGIGTASPTQALHVEGKVKIRGQASNTLIIDGSVSDDVAINLVKEADNTKIAAQIKFDGYSPATDVKGDIRFFTANSADSGSTNGLAERMTVARDGYIGIGINAPTSLLHLVSAAPTITLMNSAVNTLESGRIRFTESAATGYQGSYIHYDGSTNLLNIGTHEVSDSLVASDVPVLTIDRTTGLTNFTKAVTMASTLGVNGNIATNSQLNVTGTTQLNNTTTITKQGDGAVLLTFNTERAWSFMQVGTGATTGLALRASTDGKEFLIQNSDGSTALSVITSSTASERSVKIDGSKVLTEAMEGHGKGVDADTVDGLHATSIMMSSVMRQTYVVSPAAGLASLTSITIPNGASYGVGSDRMLVFRDGMLQEKGLDYNEATTTTVQFLYDLAQNCRITFWILKPGA
jgi:hypothetical protein